MVITIKFTSKIANWIKLIFKERVLLSNPICRPVIKKEVNHAVKMTIIACKNEGRLLLSPSSSKVSIKPLNGALKNAANPAPPYAEIRPSSVVFFPETNPPAQTPKNTDGPALPIEKPILFRSRIAINLKLPN